MDIAACDPVMLSTSYEPPAVTEGTPIEQPEAGPVTGVIPRMDAIGVTLTHVTEEVTTRAPRPYKTENLRIPAGVASVHPGLQGADPACRERLAARSPQDRASFGSVTV
ncbi:GntR family transcriptional regulator [Actinocorallia populi]|uniref:hypothetical protein n=1 Tax=Actinocorallia populi TaxID=2079200 RepID=UPI00130049FD|nr:hypothetical protein [Actinocorallia populi]